MSAGEYVRGECWRNAPADACPRCQSALKAHGTYPRVNPEGFRVARFRCPCCRQTVSFLPSFMCAWATSTLAEVEECARVVARLGLSAGAEVLRRDILPRSARQWTARRVAWVGAALAALVVAFPDEVRPGVTLGEAEQHVSAGTRVSVGLGRAGAARAVLEGIRLRVVKHLQSVASVAGFRRAPAARAPPV